MKKLILLFLLLLPAVSAQCIDTDGGLDYFIRGNATFTDDADVVIIRIEDKCLLNGAEVSTCSGSDCYLEEAYCENERPDSSERQCPEGCFNGECEERMVTLATFERESKDDDKIIMGAFQRIKTKGYEVEFDDIVYFHNVKPKYSDRVILAVKRSQAILLVKDTSSSTHKKLGDAIEEYLKEEDVDYERKTFISTNDLNDLFNFCRSDKNCRDGPEFTKGVCEGEPKTCVYKEIKECVSDDDFCPSSCSYPEDPDCNECEKAEDCDDEKNSTKDSCKQKPTRCFNEEITTCIEDGYCPPKCNAENDEDCVGCRNDEDCNDGNPCTVNTCVENNCQDIVSQGCAYGEECLEEKTRIDKQYCGSDGSMRSQKRLDEGCSYDYECRTEYCSSICKKPSAWNKFWGWVFGVF